MEQSSGGGSNAANSSDFVRKLYKMLESGTDDSVVRWGDQGDSFVVLENEKFTKYILPKHFKHSNFASFVRQLNKYDFHKVRHNNEEGGGSPYGPGAWEFKHPDFKMNNKDALDNIRRKAPAARKSAPQGDDLILPTQQVDMLNTQLIAMQQQIATLENRNNDMTIRCSMLTQELTTLQTYITNHIANHSQILQQLLRVLDSDDERKRRKSKTFPGSSGDGGASALATADHLSAMGDEPESPLQHASKLLNEANMDVLVNHKGLNQMNEVIGLNGAMGSSPDMNGRTSTGSAPPSAGSSGTLRFAELDHLVYPVGQTNGINPMFPEHAANIPYNLNDRPAEQPMPVQPPRKGPAHLDPGWVRKPDILLVEDDPTCRRIGTRFLQAFNCNVTSAHDGLQAVEKHREGRPYDMVLMDIIMPNLDGCSAAHFLRQSDAQTPIIAMTANVRSDDVTLYYHNGMNDVLPKPFTKEGLLQVLEKHLYHLKKPNQVDHLPQPTPAAIHLPTTRALLKEDDSPQKSPATMSNWASPNAVAGISPVASTHGAADDYASLTGGVPHPHHHPAAAAVYGLSPHQQQLSPHQQQQQGIPLGPNGVPYTPTGPPRRHIDQISGGEDGGLAAKRQHMYGNGMGQMGGLG